MLATEPTPGWLEHIGVDGEAERVYVRLIDTSGATLDEIARLTPMPRQRASAVCARLEALGLVSRSTGRPTRYVPASPDVAIESLVRRRSEGLERARLSAISLLERYRRGMRSSTRIDEFVEVIAGGDAIAQRFRQLQSAVEREIRVFDKPPYVLAPEANEPSELELLRRGVVARVVYDTSALMPDQLRNIQHLMAQGEQARTMSDVPIKLVIADRRVGLVPLRPQDPGLEGRLVVHESPLLDALIMLFDTLWERAMPLRGRVAGPSVQPQSRTIADEDRTLLMLLTAGLKDEAIAQRLGVTERTVARRMQRLFHTIGAQTRFQAGLKAAELM